MRGFTRSKSDSTESDVPKQISDFLKLKGWIVFKHRNVGELQESGPARISRSRSGKKGSAISEVRWLSAQ
jgi:hypothetical protein